MFDLKPSQQLNAMKSSCEVSFVTVEENLSISETISAPSSEIGCGVTNKYS
jgi:hypothetical protein